MGHLLLSTWCLTSCEERIEQFNENRCFLYHTSMRTQMISSVTITLACKWRLDCCMTPEVVFATLLMKLTDIEARLVWKWCPLLSNSRFSIFHNRWFFLMTQDSSYSQIEGNSWKDLVHDSQSHFYGLEDERPDTNVYFPLLLSVKFHFSWRGFHDEIHVFYYSWDHLWNLLMFSFITYGLFSSHTIFSVEIW